MAASSGMAAAWASNAYEANRLQWNQRQRLEAGNNLFNSQMRMATLEQEIEEQARADANLSREVLQQYQDDIRRGDKQALVDFMNDNIQRQGGTGAVLVGDVVYALDEMGAPAEPLINIADASPIEMLAFAKQQTYTENQLTDMYVAQTESNLQRQAEMDMARMKMENDLAVAAMNNNGRITAAQISAMGRGMGGSGGYAGFGGAGGMPGLIAADDLLRNNEQLQDIVNTAAADSLGVNQGEFTARRDEQGNPYLFNNLTQMPEDNAETLFAFQQRRQRLATDIAANPAQYPTTTVVNTLNVLAGQRQNLVNAARAGIGGVIGAVSPAPGVGSQSVGVPSPQIDLSGVQQTPWIPYNMSGAGMPLATGQTYTLQ